MVDFRKKRVTLTLLAVASALAPAALAQVGPPAYTITTIAGSAPPNGSGSTSVALSYVFNLAVDSSGNVYVALRNRIYKAATDGTFNAVAGTGTAGYSGDGGPALSAQLNIPQGPAGLAVDSTGNLYIGDSANYRIRKVSGGIITTFAGNGTYGYSGDGGPAAYAQISNVAGIAIDASGNVYFSDTNNHRVRKVSGGVIATVAGTGTGGYTGDNVSATASELNYPSGVAVDNNGNIFVADSDNYRVRKVAGGVITTFAGNGTYGYSGDGGPAVNAQLGYIASLAVDASGNLYIADPSAGRIRKVAGGTIATVVGGGSGCAQQTDFLGDGCAPASASLSNPYGVALDGTGNLYIADTSDYRIRKVAGGAISTLVGNGTFQYSGDNGLAVNAQFSPQGIAVQSRGTFYVADTPDYRVRKVSGGWITTAAGNGTCCYGGNNGPATSAPLNPSGVAVDSSGNFYTAENTYVREVSGGVITTFAGNGSYGYSGDGGPAAAASFEGANSVAVDGSGNVYIADTYNHRVRKVSAGVITTIAGGGPADGSAATGISLNAPTGVAVDAAGNMYIPSPNDHRVYKVSTGGVLTTVAGNGSQGSSGDNGPAAAAQLNYPYGVAVNSAGTVLYIADRSDNKVRMVSGGVITTVAGGGSGCPLQTDSVGDGCPGVSASLNSPGVVALDSTGANLYIADSLNYRIRKLTGGTITTVAGNGTCCYSGDNGLATSAQLSYATGIAVDNTTGSLYIGDSENFRVRKVLGGTITTVAGTGSYGYSGDGQLAVNAQLGYAYGVAVDGSGTLYIADAGNARIRKVSGNVITTVAGSGVNGYSGDNGQATSAQIGVPYDVAVDGSGNLYIADTSNNRIRIVSGGNIATIAGNGFSSYSGDGGPAGGAQLSSPSGVAVDGSGNLYIADAGNARIRKVSGGAITTVAGNGTCCYSGDNGPATAASITPAGIAADNAGNLYLSDTNHSVVRKVSGGLITTIAGVGYSGYSGDGGPALGASLSNPQALAVDSYGNVYVADTGNYAIRLLTMNPETVTSLVPSSATAGTSGFTLQVYGSGFAPGDSVQWNGTSLTTTFVTAGQLNAVVTSAQIAQPGTAAITVNGLSNVIGFSVTNAVPTPAITSLSPSFMVAGGGAFTLSVNGSGFAYNSSVRWNGSSRTTIFISSSQLTAAISAADVASAGSASVTVFNPAPGGGASNAASFAINAAGTGLQFYPVTPCRIADTRSFAAFPTPFGAPSMTANSSRSFPVPSSTLCSIPSTAVAYSLNITAVPKTNYLGWITVWPTGQAQPVVSTLNAWDGLITANAAVVPAGAGGAISIYASDPTDVFFDIDGYFAPPQSTSLDFYPVTPCRIADTRSWAGFTGSFGPPSLAGNSSRSFPILSSSCGLPSTASAYSLNVTAVPKTNYLGWITVWPTGQAQPVVSTLNAWDGLITANAAIVPAGTNGAISIYASDPTDVFFDVDGYYAPPLASGLKFYPVAPCRVADTRSWAGMSGAYGPPSMAGNSTRSFPLPSGPCGIPATAAAYSVNITAVPTGTYLGWLSTWPAGTAQPVVSTLNAWNGLITANAAFVPAGPSSAISIYVSDGADVFFDINGYFAP